MENQDKEKFWKMMNGLAQMFGRLSVNDEMVELYFQALKLFTYEQISEAALKYLTTGKYLPRPVELLEIIFGTAEQRARDAFLTAVRAMESVKSYQSIAFEDKTTHETIFAIGKWCDFCQKFKEDRAMLEARFIKWHKAAQTAEKLKAPKIILGTHPDSDKNYLEVGKDDVIRCMQMLQEGNRGRSNP